MHGESEDGIIIHVESFSINKLATKPNLTLTRFHARVFLVNHIDSATAADHTVVAISAL